MSADLQPDVQLEIGHVLFMDVVGYSKLLVNEQRELLQQLSQIVRNTEQVRIAEAADKLIRIPAGDGMALVFFNSPEAPVRCAMEISKKLKEHPQLQLRMGIHSGPVNRVRDVNDQTNVAGAGINTAQRVMDCGDAGHILLSRHIAEDLGHYRQWQPHLHDLGECTVKHGARIHVVNFYTGELGNPELPEKLRPGRISRSEIGLLKGRWALIAAVLAIIGALAVAIPLFLSRPSIKPASALISKPPPIPDAEIPEKSIAVLPFENRSDDKQNAYFAEGIQDEILTNLAKIADLRVISRTSVMQYKSGAERNLREIGQQLGAAHVLEGSVQRSSNRVRVAAQLIDARTDTHQWAERYDRDLADVFAIQSEIAKAIADQLEAKLSPQEKARVEEKPTREHGSIRVLFAGEPDRAKSRHASGGLQSRCAALHAGHRARSGFCAGPRAPRVRRRGDFSLLRADRHLENEGSHRSGNCAAPPTEPGRRTLRARLNAFTGWIRIMSALSSNSRSLLDYPRATQILAG